MLEPARASSTTCHPRATRRHHSHGSTRRLSQSSARAPARTHLSAMSIRSRTEPEDSRSSVLMTGGGRSSERAPGTACNPRATRRHYLDTHVLTRRLSQRSALSHPAHPAISPTNQSPQTLHHVHIGQHSTCLRQSARQLHPVQPPESHAPSLFWCTRLMDSGEVPRGEKMLYSGTDPESYITLYT